MPVPKKKVPARQSPLREAMSAAVQRRGRPTSTAPQRVLTSPPPGSYDPAIDAQVGQANRGLGDLLSDYVRDYGEPGTAQGGRSGEDFNLGRDAVNRGAGRSLADLLSTRARTGEDFGRARARAGEDFGTARARAGENYGQAVAGLQRGFAQLGAQQGQASRAAGVQRGGALAQALAKRTANEAIARQPIDQGFARFGEDSARAEGRFNADTNQSESRFNADSAQSEQRLGEDKQLGLAGLQRGFLRGVDDAGVGLARAGRENTAFGLDANATRFFQANIPINEGRGEQPAGGPPKPPGVPVRPTRPRGRRAGPYMGPVNVPTPGPNRGRR